MQVQLYKDEKEKGENIVISTGKNDGFKVLKANFMFAFTDKVNNPHETQITKIQFKHNTHTIGEYLFTYDHFLTQNSKLNGSKFTFVQYKQHDK